MELIKNFFRVILVVLGIINYYPDVEVENVFVYKDFNDKELIRSQIKFKNLLNSAMMEVIKSGNRLEISCIIKSYYENKLVFSDKITKNISYESNVYYLDNKKFHTEESIIDWISVFDFVILKEKSKFVSKTIETQIEIYCSSDLNVDIMALWGNKPKIIISYEIEK
ncbi:MAG: hypothetical protein N2258_05750 [Brevinematales bacterium]|nr:hypothetical protein [Brevinematales bacterium]